MASKQMTSLQSDSRYRGSSDVIGTSHCALCSGIVSPDVPWNRALFESENFVAVPSLGALVEGWLLIVPREHAICVGALSPSRLSEFNQFKREVSKHLVSSYGDHIYAFEHGPCGPNRTAGCGVDHAHAHLVPLDFDLIAAARPYMPEGVSWVHASWSECTKALDGELDYLFVEEPEGSGHIAVADRFGSQILRKTIAAATGKRDEFDWRSNPMHESTLRTIDRISMTRNVELRTKACDGA